MTNGRNEWLKQADYDLKTAELMLESKRYVYVIFMCHLAIEKSFKALVLIETGKFPPKTHDLIRLMNLGKIVVPQDLLDFVGMINNAAVVTRYPEDLNTLIASYPRAAAKNYLEQTREVIRCVKKDPKLRK